MPYKCGVANCKGNYNEENKCRVFKIPKDQLERQRWLAVLPPRVNFVVDPAKFFICEKHWPSDTPMVVVPGGYTRPATVPSIFNVPTSCLPTPKPSPRPPKQEDRQWESFQKRDKIKLASLSDFVPEKELRKKYDNLLISRSAERFVCIFMSSNYQECKLTVIVDKEKSDKEKNDKEKNPCSPLVFSAFKNGIKVPQSKTLLCPKTGLTSYSQFYAAVHISLNYDIPLDDVLKNVVTLLQSQKVQDCKKATKIDFLINQMRLLTDKHYSVKDYCFAVEAFPRCNYELLREYLVLPCKRKLQAIISSVNVNEILTKTFQKVPRQQQKNVMLLVDEVKIRPTVAFSGGVLSGMAKNIPDSKATSMLCVMMKCLHRGPSVMLSVTPVHKLTAAYQFNIVKEAAAVVEQSGGTVIGSITDNHKINQHYCKLFDRPSESEHPATASHPLDTTRSWYLLFDTVHLLKCIRNNWISEKSQKLSFGNQAIGSFSDVKKLYEAEKGSILKTSPLTAAAVLPSNLQLQNVQHVLKVFNEKVVAALKLQGCDDTACFIQFVLNWWNTVNVSAKGQEIRLNDQHRHVQDLTSSNLTTLHAAFKQASSGHGASRVACVTHDTKKAMVQTMQGLAAVCEHLLTRAGFSFVLLREIQSDRIEGEFSVYRQSTGANAFMTSGDVEHANKKRLTRYAASYLESMDFNVEQKTQHTCIGFSILTEDAASIEGCVGEPALSENEERSAAYVAGWLERKCEKDLTFDDEEALVSTEVSDFIAEVSRGSLITPHQSTFNLVRYGLAFVKKERHRACCRQRVMLILRTIENFYDIDTQCDKLRRHLANVLLSGLHNLEQDNQKNGVLLQTSIKKARLSN